ncbi:cytochrome c-type biogenesis protein CcmH [Bisgaardia hudsonensis]|uniref:Cytochrome c-type biogenesis protein n=1 Tax=Bisgaardia hudsonensis TaxID=109472 RepID=A0A4R2N2H2_9PAST|nr:cytochrome c-type biogenesis protein [Bisgaardia hudsonensis]QLB12512.1 hypothetical protein A6A11_02290 [Bisgaardia hudsonensis]TCP14051.1 cytochrome c-type biogenesis protein CcmH [Bisgaardia hudsonensis]
MRKSFYFITALFLGILFTSFSFAAIEALNFKSIQQEEDYHSLTQALRCPQCQNNSIADSNASISVDMRAKVFELLEAGKTKEEITQYMIDRYGNFITYDPPITIATSLLWIIPIILILLGIFFVLHRQSSTSTIKNNKNNIESEEQILTDEERARLQALLNNKGK